MCLITCVQRLTYYDYAVVAYASRLQRGRSMLDFKGRIDWFYESPIIQLASQR